LRTSELGVVVVMVIMGAFPNGRRAESKYSKDSHDDTRQTRFGQYRLMLLVVVNHEKPENQQPSENTANNLAREPEIPESPRDESYQQKSSGKDIPPTPGWVLHRIRFSSQYKVLPCSQCGLQFYTLREGERFVKIVFRVGGTSRFRSALVMRLLIVGRV
jgi:hypothetical protein